MKKSGGCRWVGISIALYGAVSSCLPPELEKYRNKESSRSQDRVAHDLMAPASLVSRHGEDVRGTQPKTQTDSPILAHPSGAKISKNNVKSNIYSLDGQTFRIPSREEEVWDAMLEILMKHYSLTVVDRASGVIATDWDTYTRAKTVYRNKITLRLRKFGRNAIDLTIRNNIEQLHGSGEATQILGALWLPTEDHSNEVQRIVQNIAILLKLTPPSIQSDEVPHSPVLSAKSM